MSEPHVIGRVEPGILAVHKPAGWRVHPADPDGTPDLLTWLREQRDIPSDTAPAQRIDQDASGLVLCGETKDARALVTEWLTEGAVEKTYLVVVHGRARKKGVVRRPLQDQRRKRPLPAVTRYRCLERMGGFSLLAVQIETGRKHQIRRHLHGIGHPVVGDQRYRKKRKVRVPGWPNRLFLHARALVLPDGTVFEDHLPDELLACLAAMRGGAAGDEE